jgi:hypothetical protein
MCSMHTGNYHHDDICRNVTSALVYIYMYAIDNRFELQEREREKKKERAIWSLIFFDHHRFASIIIFLKFCF